jgi:predicted  nucleic acid-binding Zn-ribbon protein
MSDPPGVPSALGIEAVEWFAHGGDSLTIQVTGRWRRRRPAWGGQPLLVIEAEGTRHRFPAMPEPPSLGGAAPGTWRITFSVPAWLAPHLGGRIWLQFGSVVVPLPVAVGPGTEPDAQQGPAAVAAEADPETLAQRRLRSSEVALDAARRRASEAEDRAADLHASVEQLQHELMSMAARLADRERAQRAAEQRAFSEQSLRTELVEEFAELRRAQTSSSEAMAELARSEERVRQVEEELELARHSASITPGEERLRGTVAALRQELAARTSAEAEVRAVLAEVQGRLQARAAVGPKLESTLRQLRDELRQLRGDLERETDARVDAELRADQLEQQLRDHGARAERAYQALDSLREELDAVRAALGGAGPSDSPEGPGKPQAERLEEALARLREATPPRPAEEGEAEAAPSAQATTAAAEPEAASPAQPATPPAQPEPAPPRAWLRRVFNKLAAAEPDSAGRLLLQLLAAQALIHPEDVAYDLVLSEHACVQVTVDAGVTAVAFAEAPRAPTAVQFQVIGDLASIVRLLVTGRVRRHFRRRRARIRGQRSAFSALRELVSAAVTLDDLHEAGVRLDPPLALRVVSLLIDASMTRGEQFTLAYQELGAEVAGNFLHVRDGGPISATEGPLLAPVTTTVVCRADLLLPVLGGERPTELVILGDGWPLDLLALWLQAAQSA